MARAPASTTANEGSRLLTSGAEPPAPPYEAVLIVGCVHDYISPPAGIRKLHGALRGSELVWFDAGHWPNLVRDCPSDFGDAVRAFLQERRPLPTAVLAASSAAEQLIRPPGRGFDCSGCVLL